MDWFDFLFRREGELVAIVDLFNLLIQFCLEKNSNAPGFNSEAYARILNRAYYLFRRSIISTGSLR